MKTEQDDHHDDDGDDNEGSFHMFVAQIHKAARSYGCVAVESFTCDNPQCERDLIAYHGFQETLICGYCGKRHASKAPSPAKQLKNAKIESALDLVQAMCPPASSGQMKAAEELHPHLRSLMQVYALDTANKLIRRLRTLMELDAE